MYAPPKRRRFRFGLRGLIVLTTLVGLYFACWWPTKTTGVADFTMWYSPRNGGYGIAPEPVAPLLLAVRMSETRITANGAEQTLRSHYFVWAFGWLAELPFTTESVRPVALRGRSPSPPPRVPILSNPVLPTSLPPGPPVT